MATLVQTLVGASAEAEVAADFVRCNTGLSPLAAQPSGPRDTTSCRSRPRTCVDRPNLATVLAVRRAFALIREGIRDEEDLPLPRLQDSVDTAQLRRPHTGWEAVRKNTPTPPYPVRRQHNRLIRRLSPSWHAPSSTPWPPRGRGRTRRRAAACRPVRYTPGSRA
ncbi:MULTISPECIES: hypothetical protein [unclassified Streptomyces]|uniref:hypothetical protein n=1 Tax=unclassified Streptomyces TaxID=2593676 RepID=UPI003329A9EA